MPTIALQRVRSESELQRQRQDIEKFSKELAKSYKQLDASVQVRLPAGGSLPVDIAME